MSNAQDKTPKDLNGCTPLHYAAMMGNFDLCKFILQHVDKKDPMDNKGEAMAKAMGYLNVVDLIDSYLSPN